MKKFVLGFLTCLMLSISTMVLAASYTATTATFPIIINGKEFKTDKPILAIDGSTYLPLRAIGEALDVKVEWNSELKRVEIGEAPATQSNTTAATLGEQNALKSAKSYLSLSAYSYESLKHQLEFEGYSEKEINYAADNCGADWNEQAYKSAKGYLSFTSFSKDGLRKQLEFEGFTDKQINYAIEKIGY